MTKSKNVDELRITTQYRSKRGMEYELKCAGSTLSLHVTPRENASDVGEWRVEARVNHQPDAVIIAGWGDTRTDALREAARSWESQSATSELPPFDWDAVVVALTQVRAL